jgi:hypothetical protein
MLTKRIFATSSNTISTTEEREIGMRAPPDQSIYKEKGEVALAEAENWRKKATERATGEIQLKRPEPTLTFTQKEPVVTRTLQ